MESEDPWSAPDKLYHILFCFSLTIFFSFLATRTRYSFIRHRNISIGSFLSLLAGAAKEAADQFGFFQSSGASAKDAIADFIGVVLACLTLSLYNYISSRNRPESLHRDRGIALV